MTIVLNGEKAESRGATNIAELIQRYDLHAETILIEHNGTGLHRREWVQTELRDGDRIEIVQVAAGG